MSMRAARVYLIERPFNYISSDRRDPLSIPILESNLVESDVETLPGVDGPVRDNDAHIFFNVDAIHICQSRL